ncbi:S8 family serine peptidase, partial [Gemmatimonadota bacterium]
MHRPVRSGSLAFQSGTAFRSVLALAAGTLFSFLIAAPGVMGQQAEVKLDPILRAMLLRLQQAEELQQPLRDPYEMDRVYGASRAEAEVEPWVRVFVRGGSPGGAVTAVGGAVGSQAGNIVTARVPLSQLSELASLGGVDRIQAATLQYVTMDSVLIETGADVVQSSYGYTGTGVTVGVLDTGIDYTHADFIHSTGTSRVLSLWDQTVNDPTRYPTGFSYGTEWLKTDIDDEIDGTPAGVITQYDYNGHGTHVAGIAAGNGLATGSYTGMAPDANLVIVKGGDAGFYDTDVVNGVNYIFGKAGALAQPCVVNLSLGGHSGPHDGTSLYEQALDGLVGPGQIIVAAAGNEGSDHIHHRTSLSGIADQDSFQVEIPSYTPNSGSSDDYVLFNIWYYGGSNVSILVRAP